MTFSADITWYICIAFAILCGVLSWWFYRKASEWRELSPWQPKLLAVLRGVTLFILVLLLCRVVVDVKKDRREKPIAFVVIDNSASMLNHSSETQLKSEIGQWRNKLKDQLDERFEWIEKPLYETGDSLQFKGEVTDLSSHFRNIREQYLKRNVGAVVLLSDGNYNRGSHPAYVASEFNFVPFYSVGYGDTTIRKDVLVKEVLVNEYAYLKNDFPIQADIETKQWAGKKLEVQLLINDQVVDQKTLSVSSNYSFETVQFMQNAKKVGIQKVSIRVPFQSGEISKANNSKTVFVEVLDSRSKILLLAEAPHPDLAAIRSALSSGENNEVVSQLLSEWKGELSDLDLIVWHEPGLVVAEEKVKRIVAAKVPVLWIIGPRSSVGVLQRMGMPIRPPSGNQTDRVEAGVEPAFKAFSLSDETQQFFNRLPPLTTYFGKVQIPNDAQILLRQKIGPVVKTDPVQFFYESNGTKQGVILGEGIWNWRLQNYLRSQHFNSFDEWINKTTQYLIVRENRSPFVVNIEKRYNRTEEIKIAAEVYDGNFELNNSEKVSFTLRDDSGKKRQMEFAPHNNSYKLNVGRLRSGVYSWTSSVMRNGKRIVKSGEFIVEDVQLEQLDVEANFASLRLMAQQTDGDFFTFDDSDSLAVKLNARKELTEVVYRDSNFWELIDWKLLFFILLCVAACEWFLRKWWGHY